MRSVMLGFVLAALAVPAWAGETAPAPAAPPPASPPQKAEKAEAPGIASQAIELPKSATAIARGGADEEILVATDDGAVLKLVVGRGVAWRAATGGEAVERLAAAPGGEALAAATVTELLVFGAKQDAPLWRVPRPIGFAFDPTGTRLISVTKQAEVVEQEAATGKEVARRQIAEKRGVEQASLHPDSGLAVLGVADG